MTVIFEDENGRRFDSLEDAISDEIAGLLVDFSSEMDRNLVRKTPVDTGKARANWQWQTGGPEDFPEGVLNQTSRPITQQPNFRIRKARILAGDDILAANNVPYIGRLNDGYSAQAPRKFVEMAIDEAILEIFGG